MKILFYDQFSLNFGGGGEIWLVNVAQHLAQRGCKVHVVTTEKIARGVKLADPADLLSERPLFQVTKLRSLTLPMGFPLIQPSELGTLLRRIAVSDVVYYIHGVPFLEIPLLLIAKALLGKTVIAVYEGPMRPQKYFLRLIRLLSARLMISLGVCDGHHVLNQTDRDLLVSFGAENVRIIPNGVDVSLFQQRGDNRRTGTFRVLFVGRLSYQKGFDTFCEVVSLVNAKMRASGRIRFTVIGSGPLVPRLRELARVHGNVNHFTYVPNKEMAEQYSKANLMFAPYRYEGQPLAIVEAQACGLPVVATALPGICETIIDGETGIVVRDGGPQNFVEPILRYYRIWSEDRSRYRTIRAEARNNSLRFSWDRITELMIQFIRDMTGGSKSRLPEDTRYD